MQIIEVDVNDIKKYNNNVKDHPQKQVDQISYSIKEFGFNDPIALDNDNTIIEGHGRYLAAKQLGMQGIPCIILNDLSDQQKKAYILAHNKLTLETGFDLSLLSDELEAIKSINMDPFDFEIQTDLPDLDNDYMDDFEGSGEGAEPAEPKQIEEEAPPKQLIQHLCHFKAKSVTLLSVSKRILFHY